MGPRCTLGKSILSLARFALAAILLPAAHAQFTGQAKLVGASTAGYWEFQGESVALSADGNTALVGQNHIP